MQKTIRAMALLTAAFALSGCLDTLTKVGTSVAVNTGVMSQDTADSLVKTAESVSKAAEEITPEQEYYIGRAVGAQVLAQYPAYTDPEANLYLNNVGQTVAAFSDRPQTFGGYHFQILDTDEVNAFAAPGGLIFVSRGLLRLCDSEDAVAGVLAHEIVHATHQHGLKAIKKSRWTAAATVLATELVKHQADQDLAKLTSAFEDVISDITAELINSGYARELESEADGGAVALLQRVGYRPDGYRNMLTALRRLKSDKGFFKTHPSPASRLKEVNKAIGKYRGTPPNNTRIARFKSGLATL